MKSAPGAPWRRSDAPTYVRNPKSASTGFKTASILKPIMVAPAHVRVYGPFQLLPLEQTS